MQLNQILERCRRLEERVAALYRAYATSARAEPSVCALWTGLAREEEGHAHALALARSRIVATEGWRTWVEGWEEALVEVEQRVAAGEKLVQYGTARQLSAALDLEMTELEVLRRVLLAACHEPPEETSAAHAVGFAKAAAKLSDDPHVRLQAALLHARARGSKVE